MENGAKNVLVIGSGPGGMGLAALLQSRGHQVTLLEKNEFYGGKCSSHTREAFLVDSSFHAFSMGDSGPHGEITRMVQGDLRWHVHNPLATARFGERGCSKITQSIPMWIPYGAKAYATGALRPSIINGLRSTLRNWGVRELVRTMVKIAMLDENFICSLDEMTGREFLLKFTDDRHTHQLFAVVSLMAFVIPYTEVSAGELIWCLVNSYRNHTLGVPRGGAREIPGSFMRAFVRYDGRVRMGCEVNRILVEGGKARGVQTSDGEEIKADIVVSNAGIKRTVEMAGAANFPEEYVSYVKGLRESYAALILKYALDRRIEEIPQFCFLNIPDLEADHMVDYVFEGGVPEEPPFCMLMPPDWDPHVAPPGKQLIIAGGMGQPDISHENINHCEQILDKMEEGIFGLFPQIERHVEWKERSHVAHVGAITGKPTGECIGLAQCVGQVGSKKPSARTPVEDLWLVGCDAGARGVGTEQAAGSAIYVANLLT